jgi:hypothetical protein
MYIHIHPFNTQDLIQFKKKKELRVMNYNNKSLTSLSPSLKEKKSNPTHTPLT